MDGQSRYAVFRNGLEGKREKGREGWIMINPNGSGKIYPFDERNRNREREREIQAIRLNLHQPWNEFVESLLKLFSKNFINFLMVL